MQDLDLRGGQRHSRGAASEEQTADRQADPAETENDGARELVTDACEGRDQVLFKARDKDERKDKREEREKDRQPADHKIDQLGILNVENAQQNEPDQRHDPEDKDRLGEEGERADALQRGVRRGAGLFDLKRRLLLTILIDGFKRLDIPTRVDGITGDGDDRAEITGDHRDQTDDDHNGEKPGQFFGLFRDRSCHYVLLSAEGSSAHQDNYIIPFNTFRKLFTSSTVSMCVLVSKVATLLLRFSLDTIAIEVNTILLISLL